MKRCAAWMPLDRLRRGHPNRHGSLDWNVRGTHMAGTFAKATAIGGLPVPVTAIVLTCPASSCFPDPESSNLNRLRLISFRLAHARVRSRSPFEPMRRARRHSGSDGSEGIGRTLIPDPDEKNAMADHPHPGPPPSRGRERAESPPPSMGEGLGGGGFGVSRRSTTRNVYASARGAP
jgi:hypothetical protein